MEDVIVLITKRDGEVLAKLALPIDDVGMTEFAMSNAIRAHIETKFDVIEEG